LEASEWHCDNVLGECLRMKSLFTLPHSSGRSCASSLMQLGLCHILSYVFWPGVDNDGPFYSESVIKLVGKVLVVDCPDLAA